MFATTFLNFLVFLANTLHFDSGKQNNDNQILPNIVRLDDGFSILTPLVKKSYITNSVIHQFLPGPSGGFKNI